MAASAGEDSYIKLHCLKKMQELKSYQGHTSVYCVAFSKCDTMLVSGEKDGFISVWNIANLNENNPLYKLNGHKEAIYHLIYAENFLLSCCKDGIIRLWRQTKQIAFYQIAISNNGIGVALSKDEQLIAGNCVSYTYIWNVKQGKMMIKWANQKGKQGNMCFANNSKLLFQSLVSCTKVWNCYNMKPKLIRKANLGYSFDCSVSSDSTILAISNSENYNARGQIHLIDISTWKIAQKLKLDMFCEDQNYLNFSSDDQYIGTGNAYGEVKLFRNVLDDKEDEGDQIQKLQIQCLEKLQK